MKSLQDLSNKYNLSRMTLQRRMKDIPNFKQKYCTRGKRNKLLINQKGEKLICFEKHNSTSNYFHTRHGTSSNQITKADLIKQHKQDRIIINRLSKALYAKYVKHGNKKLPISFVNKYKLAIADKNFYQADTDKRIAEYNEKGRIYRFFHKMPK